MNMNNTTIKDAKIYDCMTNPERLMAYIYSHAGTNAAGEAIYELMRCFDKDSLEQYSLIYRGIEPAITAQERAKAVAVGEKFCKILGLLSDYCYYEEVMRVVMEIEDYDDTDAGDYTFDMI